MNDGDKKWKSDYSIRPAFDGGVPAQEPVKIANEGEPMPPGKDEKERDPTMLKKLVDYERKVKQKTNNKERLLDSEYTARSSAERALERAGFHIGELSCPYAIEQRYSSRTDIEGVAIPIKVWKIVEDEDGRIKGAQEAHKKNLVGREYSSDAAAYTALARKGYRLSDPQCPYRVVKIAPTVWRIDIKRDASDRILEVKNLLRAQMLFLSDPEQQEKALAYVAAQIHDIYK